MQPRDRAMAVVSMDRMLTNSRPNHRPSDRLNWAWNFGIHWAGVIQIARRWGGR